MNVFLSFDIEVWCNGWDQLDAAFPASFERYVYGRSSHGAYALPKTLEILQRHGLRGVFFVEPLFAARFGIEPLREIVGLIRTAGQEVQLHLHPEWTDEAVEPLITNCQAKRQHLNYYTLDEQTALIGHGRRLLEAAGSGTLSAFRAGSYAINRDGFAALQLNGFGLDSSLNRCYAISAPDMRSSYSLDAPFVCEGVSSFPITVFRDGFGRHRPAQVGACGAEELFDALHSAWQHGASSFVIVSHNFEMLRAGRSEPDWIVVRRFEALCAHLAEHRERYQVRGFSSELLLDPTHAEVSCQLQVSRRATLRRHAEQLARRLYL